MRKRHGFTMIELIFVIVILGILAAVAVPKLAATRTDASVAKMATNISVVISDLGSSYTAQGVLGKWDDATNVPLMIDATTKISNTDVTTAVYLYNGDSQCIKLIATVEGNLTMSNGSNTTDAVCKGVQSVTASSMTSHIFGGSRININ